jgi:ferredoxin
MYKINKQKCTACRLCVQKCPGATQIGKDGKAEIIDQEKLQNCGGESLCPFGAIEKIGGSPEIENEPIQNNLPNRNLNKRRGRGLGAGRGRGLGVGPRDSRGRGQGGGGRRW